MTQPLLAVRGVKTFYGNIKALKGIDLDVNDGEIVTLIGANGAGKSTLLMTVCGSPRARAGTVRLEGEDITRLDRAAMRPRRRRLQVIFQDPYASLDPRMSAGEIVGEPLRNYDIAAADQRRERVAALFARVGLRADQMRKYPHEFSGGQRQRLGIARALAVEPKVIVCDEPVSALDVSVQAQVINLLMDLQGEFGLSYLFIAHDLAVVEHICQRVAVMYLGRIVELAPRRALFAQPQHPYTEALLSAVPVPDPDPAIRRRRIILAGDVPSPINPPAGCRFHTRCPYVFDRCRTESPELRELSPGHYVACHLRT